MLSALIYYFTVKIYFNQLCYKNYIIIKMAKFGQELGTKISTIICFINSAS